MIGIQKRPHNDLLLEEVIEMRLTKGASRPTVVKHLTTKYGYTRAGAYYVYKSATKAIGKLMRGMKRDPKVENLLLMEGMLEKCIAEGNLKLALSIIQEMNKCSDLYQKSIEIGTDSAITIEIN